MDYFRVTFAFLVLLLSIPSLSAELFKIKKANLSFDTYIRVETSAKIIESVDPALLGASLPFHQSLRYSASKELLLDRAFSSSAEIKQFAEFELCQEVHALQLRPMRENGTKGSLPLDLKTKPNSILLTGTHVSNKGSQISSSFTCR